MASVRIEPVVAECRIYYEDNPGLHDPYQLSLNIIWLPNEPGAVFASMHVAQKPHTRATMRALVKALVDLNIKVVYAYRADGHILPRAEKQEDGTWRLDLSLVKDRI